MGDNCEQRLFDSGRCPRRFGGALVSDKVREQGASVTTVDSHMLTQIAEDVFGSIEPLRQVQAAATDAQL